jgi:hypothetical protein
VTAFAAPVDPIWAAIEARLMLLEAKIATALEDREREIAEDIAACRRLLRRLMH